MKKIIAALVALAFLALPVTAEAQAKKKKKQQDNDNPIVLLLGIFSTINCIFTCGVTTSVTTSTLTTTTFTTVTTVTFNPQTEQFVTVTNQVPVTNTTQQTNYAKKFLNGYVAGAAICTVAWPFINAAFGLPEPTAEEALLNAVSCWVPGLGILIYLQQQQGT